MRIANLAAVLALGMVLTTPCSLWAAGKTVFKMPDFTKGDAIPQGANLDWNLGATGARGWIYADQVSTSDARQIRITEVDEQSPADGILEVGDVILGVGGKLFSYDPRTEMGKAITIAESQAGGGNLSLIRWRDRKTETVVVKLPVLGDYSATAPYDCPKSRAILEQGCKALARRIAAPSYRANPITRSLNALALLASGNEDYLPVVKQEAQWAAGYSADSFQTWYYGYVIMLLSEYVIQTGDDSVMPGLRRLALEAASGQSIVGSWGHRFAGSDGRLVGYGMMNAPGLPLTTSLILARKAGVNDPDVSRAIQRSVRLLRFYVGKGCIPYGDHAPWIQTHEDNGKNGMAAVLFNLLGDAQAAEYFSRMSVASHGNERDYGHTGNFFCMTWAIPGVAQSGPNATGAWMHEFGAWYFDLARRWDGTYLHQGGEKMPRTDAYSGWDCTGAYLLAYAMPLKSIYLTGKGRNNVPQISSGKAQQLLDDGRGWTRKDTNSFYDKLSTEQLIERLGSWSPIVRERAASALGRRKDDVMNDLIRLLDAPDLYAQYGACQAIELQKARGSVAASALLKAYESDDVWLRILIGQALAGIGEPAKPTVPQLLARLATPAPENDPRNMEQRFLAASLFAKRGGLIGGSLEGVDRPSLLKAVRATLQNEDGRARSNVTTVYANLSYEEIKPLLPAILQAVVEPAPSGIMFADQIRMEGLRLLGKHRVKEGIEACVEYAQTQNHWASEKRTPQLMEILVSYGAHAKPMIPTLKQLADRFAKGEGTFPRHLSLQKAEIVRQTIRTIEASDEYPKLIHLLVSCTSAMAAEKPNIVIILADDLGYGSLNSYGADEAHIRTPNIDRLAKEGRRFTDASTPSSVCSPTRYGLLTGRYDWRTDQKHGVLNTTDPLHIETSRSTIASLLKSTGYRTAAIGKWHLGYGTEKHDFTQPLTPGPLDIGFDYHFAVPQNHGDASGVYVRNRGVVGLRSDRTVPAGTSPYGREYMGIDAPQRIDENVMDELTTEAVEWLESQRDDAPFFLYFAPVAIHFPYTPSDMTKGQSGTGLYGDWIHELDLSVGRILHALDRMNMADDTLVVFTSDNGGVLMAEGDRPEAVAYRAGLRCNGDWRGRKHSIYEGGFRVPFIVRWPGHAPASTTCDETISLVDMYATIAALLDQPVADDKEVAEDSFNVLPTFLGGSIQEPIRSSIVLHSPNGNFAIRQGPWKYIEGKASPTLTRIPRRDELGAQLYNLQDDPGEQNNLLNDHPDVAKHLAELLEDQRSTGRSR